MNTAKVIRVYTAQQNTLELIISAVKRLITSKIDYIYIIYACVN